MTTAGGMAEKELHGFDGSASGQPLRLVWSGTDEAESARPTARIHIAGDGGPIRTVVGNPHKHFVGEEHSAKTGRTNPYEGTTEHALTIESELRADVLAYRTQAFRIRLLVGSEVREWICDHLRQVRIGGVDVVEAIECKPDMSFLGDAYEHAKLNAAAKVLGRLGWRLRVLYERQIKGSGERQINFSCIYAHQQPHGLEDRIAAFDEVAARQPDTTFGELARTMSPDRVQGEAMAHAMICRGRVEVDLDRLLGPFSPIRLLPVPEFTPRIWFEGAGA